MEQNPNLPLVSILIPLYNEERLIAQTIEGCLKQTYNRIEVIVVDDHSTDNSLQVARQYESDRVRVFVNPGKGVSSARNYAFEKSHGHYVKYHDADDYISLGMIEKQVQRILDEGDEQAIAYSQLRNCYMPGEPEEKLNGLEKDYTPGIEFVMDIIRLKKHVWFSLMFLIPRTVVEKTGGWNTKYSYCEDTEFIATAMNFASKALFVEGEYAVWRIFDDKKHLHTQKQISVQKQKIEVLFYVANLILKYHDTPDTRYLCSNYISYIIFGDVVEMYLLYDYIQEMFRVNKLIWVQFENPNFRFLYKLLGWWRATMVLHKFKHFLRY